MKNVIVIGATGHFGRRICRRLVGGEDLRLFVSSRSLDSAKSFALELMSQSTGAIVEPAELDQNSPSFVADLGALTPDIVVHTAGPYQGQGYTVAQACLENDSHYIDLADGRAFVDQFGVLNETALNKNLLLVTGASTLPGLSSAVVSSFRDEFTAITEIETTIAPAHQTPRGLGTISAVMSYCGKPFSVLEAGQWRTHYGWQDLRTVEYPSLGTRLAGACDVPDLSLFPKVFPGVETVTFHAALEAPWEQLSLWLMAGISRMGLISDWSRFAAIFESVSKRLIGLGSDRGGMSIRVTGIDEDRKKRPIIWNLVAGRNHGPEIPCTPAIVLVRKLLQEQLSIRGAIPCVSLFTLEEFARNLEGYDVSWSSEYA